MLTRGKSSAVEIQHPDPASQSLSEREELVLRMIVHHYVLTANPVGSRFLSKRFEGGEAFSAATLRNVMSDLEDKGYITHPHTSAGRLPTDRGYRFYVDTLQQIEQLSQAERSVIRRSIDPTAPTPVLMKEASRLLGMISQQLGIMTAPELLDSYLERLEIISLSSTRLLVVLSLSAGIIRTVTLELHDDFPLESARLENTVQQLNERLCGLTLRQIRSSWADRLQDITPDPSAQHGGVIRLFLDAADRIFTQHPEFERVQVSPAQNILSQPEFSTLEQVRGIVELIENEEVIIHLLEGHDAQRSPFEVTIGGEHADERMANYSLITTRYSLGGQTAGTIGLIGPKRMNYSKMIAAVEYIAKTITSGMRREEG